MIDLHGEVVSQLLQDIPFIIELMELIKEKAKELSEEDTEGISLNSHNHITFFSEFNWPVRYLLIENVYARIKVGVLSTLLMSLHTHNSDTTIDLLALIQKNIGLSTVTSTALSFSSHTSVSPRVDSYVSPLAGRRSQQTESKEKGEEEKGRSGLPDISVDTIVYDPEFLDECNSVFFVFRQEVASYYSQLPTQDSEQENVHDYDCDW